MKIVKITLLSLLGLVLILLIALVVFIKTFDLNRYKPQVLSQAKAALGRDMDFKKAGLGFSLTKGLELKVNQFAIAENPEFQKGDFFSAQDILVSVDVLKLIFNKIVLVPQIVVESPQVTIIREKDGRLNVASFGAVASEPKTQQTSPAAATSPMALPEIIISSLNLERGHVIYVDRSSEPEMKIEVMELSVRIDKFSLNKPFIFMVEGAVLSDKKNIRIEGKALLDMKTGSVTVTELKGTTDLARFSLEKIPAVFPSVSAVSLPQQLKGIVEVNGTKLTVSSQGGGELSAEIVAKDIFAQFKELAAPLKDGQLRLTMTLADMVLEKASLGLASGVIEAKGTVKDYMKSPNFDITADVRNLKIQEILKQENTPVKIEANVSANLKVQGEGFSPKVLSSLTGEGTISYKEAKLKDINVLKTVLDKISVIPNVSEKVKAGLTPEASEKLTRSDTPLSDAQLPVMIKEGRVYIPEAALGSDGFLFKGAAQAGFDATFSLEGSFFITEELSSAFIAGAPELKYLLDENKQIYIPLKISGNALETKFIVDAEYIGKKLIANQAKTQLIKVIDKALGVKEAETSQATDASAASTNASTSESPAAALVESVLGSIFKK